MTGGTTGTTGAERAVGAGRRVGGEVRDPGTQGRRTSSTTKALSSPLLRDHRWARLAWARLVEPGDPRAARLVGSLGHVQALSALEAGEAKALSESTAPRLAELDVERDAEILDRLGARLVVPGDDEWPRGLDDLAAPPHCLWVRGRASLAEALGRSVSVVGARACTAYGTRVATDLAAGLVDRDFTVVSGAAYGIDGAAHRGALAAEGTTVAVLAGGIDRPYPRGHDTLIASIAETGAVMGEVPPGWAPTRTRFLQRNRLIATMTPATVVVEAGLRSGSLNTARTASEHGRVVAAVPGSVESAVSAGCHKAVRDGYAVLVTDAAEVAEVAGALGRDAAPERHDPVGLIDRIDEAGRMVLSALTVRAAITVTEVGRRTGLTPNDVVGSLGLLEAYGLIRRDGDGWRKVPAPGARAARDVARG